jgi:hypothetical protein
MHIFTNLNQKAQGNHHMLTSVRFNNFDLIYSIAGLELELHQNFFPEPEQTKYMRLRNTVRKNSVIQAYTIIRIQ